MHINMYTYRHCCVHMRVYVYVCIHIYICIYIWQRLKSIGLVTGPGGLFAKRLVTQSGGSCDKPSDKPIEDCSTVHRGPRQGFVAEGPRQGFVTEGGDCDKPLFRGTPMYTYIYIHIHTLYIYIYIYIIRICA